MVLLLKPILRASPIVWSVDVRFSTLQNTGELISPTEIRQAPVEQAPDLGREIEAPVQQAPQYEASVQQAPQ